MAREIQAARGRRNIASPFRRVRTTWLLTPTTVTFGNVGLFAKVTQTFHLLNQGSTTANITSIFTADPQQFSETTDCFSLLSAGAYCNIFLTFSPVRLSLQQTYLYVVDTPNNTTVSAQAVGYGVNALMNLDATHLDFGLQPLHKPSTAQTIQDQQCGKRAVGGRDLPFRGLHRFDQLPARSCCPRSSAPCPSNSCHPRTGRVPACSQSTTTRSRGATPSF